MQAAAAPSNTFQYTCVSCNVRFKDADLQKLHYKADWHRYNLKRKVAELPPVTAEKFQLVIQSFKNLEQASKPKNVYCQFCRKNFTNQNAYDNHLNSKKHKDNEDNFVEPEDDEELKASEDDQDASSESDVEEVDSDEWEDDTENPIDNNDCLFCLHHSRNLTKNLKHMTIVHSFFIPDAEYCVDVPGLLRYLGEKISDGFMCLWCNEKGRTFHSADAARSHMIDKSHCRMLHEGLALVEYADFYDYSSSYPDANEGVNADEEIAIPEIDDSKYQLVLPSGVTVGHRSLMRYYKQSLNPNAVVAKPSGSTKRLHKDLALFRSLGWTATQQEAAARKAKDIHHMKRMMAKLNVKLGVKGNKLLQPHFRQQVNY